MNWKLALITLTAAASTALGQTKWSDMGVEATFADGDWLMMLDASDLPGGGNQRAAFSTLRDWWFSSDNTISLGNNGAGTVVLTGNVTGTDTTLTFGNATAGFSHALTAGGNAVVTVGDTGTVTSAMIFDGTVVGGDISDNTVTASDLAATLTFADADYIDLAAILHDDTALQGLRLPQIGAAPSNPVSGEGQIGWDQTNNTLEVYDGAAWTALGSGGNVSDNTAEAITGVWEIQDDVDFVFGNDANWLIQYDEAVDDQLLFVTTGTAAIATTDPMFEILVGTTPTADQQVFGIAKGSQATNTPLFTVDEDGDVTAAGDISVTNATANRLDYTEQASISNPAATKGSIYLDSDDNLFKGIVADEGNTLQTFITGSQTGTVTGTMVAADTIAAADLAATLTLADADYLDLGAILHNDAAAQGLRLPNVGATPTDVTGATEGFIAWDETNNLILVNNGTAWSSVSAAVGADSINGTELADTITLDANLVMAGAFSYDIGNNTATTVTIDTDGTGNAEVVLPDGSISGTEILDDTVDSADYAAGSVDKEHLSADAQGIFTEILSAGHGLTGSATTGELYGSVHYVDAAATITLPAATAGMSFTVITIGAFAVTVDPHADDQIHRDGGAADLDGDSITNTTTAGDTAVFTYISGNDGDGGRWHASTDGWTSN